MRRVFLTAMISVMTGVAGCQSKPKAPRIGERIHSPAVKTGQDGETAVWPYWPAAMRVHPLTRVVIDEATQQSILETRIEFRDPDGFTSRAVGVLTMQLYTDKNVQTASESALDTWNADLLSPDSNRRHYDVVTRTYLFRLELKDLELPALPELRVFFLSANDLLLDARMEIKLHQ